MHDLQPGIYTIQLADTNLERCKAYTVELSGQDSKTVIGYPCHEGRNQQWEFATLGAEYSIRNVSNGSYLSIDFKNGLQELRPQVVALSYPVIWYVKLYEADDGVYRILSNSEYGFSMDIQADGLAPVFISKQQASADISQLWTLRRLRECECEHAPLSPSTVQLATHMSSINVTMTPTVKTVRGSIVFNTGDAFTAVFNIDGKQYIFVTTIGDSAYGPLFYSFTMVSLTYEHIGDLTGYYTFSATVDSNLSISATRGGHGWKIHGSLASAVAPATNMQKVQGTWFSA
ncbi:uncharacterized protein EV420DRAFT_557752 [Desarmillaria tabescens]|uniref:Ricin B lectin domain-containing protein n=1 Tax=Armillaria tabescens TaxID=1929756 RepID=A0AA39K6Z6_ARMTA|nr:uncharacterized protein EV420DRAFT_557752 [Desarmillaria tabescens]KAK0455729.1 hypothetical protein EV420DRAFT_557752 [Desarmillaria tabescens]